MNSDVASVSRRPKDIHGRPVIMGPWYWALSRTGKVFGAGQFLSVIASGKIGFWVNGTAYDPSDFEAFAECERQPEAMFK